MLKRLKSLPKWRNFAKSCHTALEIYLNMSILLGKHHHTWAKSVATSPSATPMSKMRTLSVKKSSNPKPGFFSKFVIVVMTDDVLDTFLFGSSVLCKSGSKMIWDRCYKTCLPLKCKRCKAKSKDHAVTYQQHDYL